ncbi:MAG: helix-turn-helix domain-containing protein [Scandinavium sp.]|uniref:helix-turn-helix domain-containing protein n=1 Tax=Scandinavium sp. TaxID=2830653 RepID=UPI003F3E316C
MGSTPEQLIAAETPEAVEAISEIAADMRFCIHLTELREATNKTQNDIAQILNVRQPTIAAMERKGRDIRLSTLKRYVEATGSKLQITVELPDGSRHTLAV